MKSLAALSAIAVPRAARACAVCFGATGDSGGLARGFWWGIVILLAVTMSLVGGIGWTLWSVERRRSETDA